MSKRKSARKKKPIVIPGDPTDPQGFARRVAEYLEWMKVKNYSLATVKRRSYNLGHFIRWCEDRTLVQPAEITRPILERYARHLYYLRKPDGHPLSFRNQYNRLSVLRHFFRWLTKKNHLLSNPASELELPKLGQQLPRQVLSKVEVEEVLNQPDVDTDFGIRDRAILETLYSTGMRRMELVNLDLYDLDVSRGTVRIREGKGQKDRVVPIGERAIDWIDRYITDVRPGLVVDPDETALFLTQYGERMSKDGLSYKVTGYVDAAAINKRGSCHLFRHTMATLMLEGGADVRYVQEMLGHSKLRGSASDPPR